MIPSSEIPSVGRRVLLGTTIWQEVAKSTKRACAEIGACYCFVITAVHESSNTTNY